MKGGRRFFTACLFYIKRNIEPLVQYRTRILI